jgi:hypothetical protein
MSRKKEGVRGGTTGSPMLINDPEFATAMADRLHEHYEARAQERGGVRG